MSRQQANIVVVEHAADPSAVLSKRHSASEINHVLCCGPEESLFEFAERVLCRLKQVREKHFIGRVAYIQADGAKYSATRQMLCRSIVALLSEGAEFELVTVPSPTIDLLLAVDSLIPVARAGVRISAVKHTSMSATAAANDSIPGSMLRLRPGAPGNDRLAKGHSLFGQGSSLVSERSATEAGRGELPEALPA